MQLIKDKQLTQDNWCFIEDDKVLNADFNIVSVNRWQTESKQLNSSTHLGLQLHSDTIIEDISDNFNHFALIELHMPVFTDGRAFTHARLLRSRYSFTGDIRVSGDFMLDQVFYLNRVGVSSFIIPDSENAEKVIVVMGDFSEHYQASVA